MTQKLVINDKKCNKSHWSKNVKIEGLSVAAAGAKLGSFLSSDAEIAPHPNPPLQRAEQLKANTTYEIWPLLLFTG